MAKTTPREIPVLKGWVRVACQRCGETTALVKSDTIPEILCPKCAVGLFYGL